MYSQQIFKKFYIKTDINQHDDKFRSFCVSVCVFFCYFVLVFVRNGMILIKEQCYMLPKKKKKKCRRTMTQISGFPVNVLCI